MTKCQFRSKSGKICKRPATTKFKGLEVCRKCYSLLYRAYEKKSPVLQEFRELTTSIMKQKFGPIVPKVDENFYH